MNVIYAADIGSIRSNNFAWARLTCSPYQIDTDSSIHNLVQAIDLDLAQGKKVSIGFECPLFINLPSTRSYSLRREKEKESELGQQVLVAGRLLRD